jgi:hypothetical protein
LIDLSGWATNWQIRSRAVRTAPIQTSPNRGGNGQDANIFSDLTRLTHSVRPPRPGETGDRNVFRGNPFSQLDMNLGKTFNMPWNENHKLQFRWKCLMFSTSSISTREVFPHLVTFRLIRSTGKMLRLAYPITRVNLRTLKAFPAVCSLFCAILSNLLKD